MNIIAVDDEQFALKGIVDAIRDVCPNAQVEGFNSPIKALEYADENRIDIAFLDIEMGGINGLTLAKRLKEHYCQTNIVFVTAHSQYALDAHALYAAGYLLKPITREKINTAIHNLRYPVVTDKEGIRVQTFGNFEVFVDGKPVRFCRSKSKEILAYLVDRNGASVTKAELAAVIWEDAEYSRSRQQQLQELIAWMIKDLIAANAEQMVLRRHNNLSVDKTQFSCDCYDFQERDESAVNAYMGEYMTNYSWAEFKLAYLEQQFKKRK